MDIKGTRSAELITGTVGDDLVNGAGGADTINGGEGFDTIDFSDPYYVEFASSMRQINLDTGTAVVSYTTDIFGGPVLTEVTSISGIENVIGSSDTDLITGDNAGNVLDGGDATDVLWGLDGDDTLIGGLGSDDLFGGRGSDTLDGGEGSDAVHYSDGTEGPGPVGVDLAAGTVWTPSGGDTLISIEHVAGTDYDDWIGGNDASNYLYGGLGNDVIFGRGSIGDTIIGGDGDDALFGSAGDDTMSGDWGMDWMEGGDGNDIMSDTGYLPDEWSAMHGQGGNDTFQVFGVGSIGVWGGEGNDTIEAYGDRTIYAWGGEGSDAYRVTNGIVTGEGGFIQVFDFEIGQDVVESVIAGPNVATQIENWGENTGVTFTDLDTGISGSVMLMGVTYDQVELGRDVVLV